MKEKKEENLIFECPNCGVIHRDDVLFLCNKCDQVELVFKDGIYMCPSCMEPGENFECLICESKDVAMKEGEASGESEDADVDDEDDEDDDEFDSDWDDEDEDEDGDDEEE